MEYGFKPTVKGRALVAKCGDQEKPFKITGVKFGKGKVADGKNLAEMEELVTYVVDGEIGERRHEDDRLYITVSYDNSKHPDQEGFNLQEFMLYAADPDTEDDVPIAYATLGDYMQPVPKYSPEIPASIFSFPMVLVIADDVTVTIGAEPGVVTHNDLNRMMNEGLLGFTKFDVTIPVESWTDGRQDMESEAPSPTAPSDYPMQAKLENAVIKAHMTPILTINPESLKAAENLCPACQTIDGALLVFAKSAPETELKATLLLAGGTGVLELEE